MSDVHQGIAAGGVAPSQNEVGSLKSASDAAVIEALRRGDEEAFARVVDQYHAIMRRIARFYVSSEAVAEEVVQDTWLAVIRGVWAFQGRSSLKTWILRILINRAKTRGVREGRTIPLADLGSDDVQLPVARDKDQLPRIGRRPSAGPLGDTREKDPRLLDPDPSPEGKLLAQEARVLIMAAIDALPPSQKMVITMRDIEGFSSEEVCNVLGLGETNQRVILHRARSRVRKMVSAYFGEH